MKMKMTIHDQYVCAALTGLMATECCSLRDHAYAAFNIADIAMQIRADKVAAVKADKKRAAEFFAEREWK